MRRLFSRTQEFGNHVTCLRPCTLWIRYSRRARFARWGVGSAVSDHSELVARRLAECMCVAEPWDDRVLETRVLGASPLYVGYRFRTALQYPAGPWLRELSVSIGMLAHKRNCAKGQF